MDYSLVTKEQLQKRFHSLSVNLKDVLNSEGNIEILRQICRTHHLNDEEKILIVEQLVGLVILGFVSPDEVSREISENIHLNKQHSDDIAQEINRKIFVPVRSDLDKIYAPLTKTQTNADQTLRQSSGQAQTDAESQRKSASSLRESAVAAANIVDLKAKIEEFRKTKELEPPATGAELRGLDADLRGSSQREPTPAISGIERPKIIPTAESQMKADKTQTDADKFPHKSALSPHESAYVEPFILHKETALKPASTQKDKPSLSGLFSFFKPKKPELEKVKAEITLATQTDADYTQTNADSQRQSAFIAKPKIVHYTELKKSVSPFGDTADQRRLDADQRGPYTQTRADGTRTDADKLQRESASSPRPTSPASELAGGRARESAFKEPPEAITKVIDTTQTNADRTQTYAEKIKDFIPAKKIELSKPLIPGTPPSLPQTPPRPPVDFRDHLPIKTAQVAPQSEFIPQKQPLPKIPHAPTASRKPESASEISVDQRTNQPRNAYEGTLRGQRGSAAIKIESAKIDIGKIEPTGQFESTGQIKRTSQIKPTAYQPPDLHKSAPEISVNQRNNQRESAAINIKIEPQIKIPDIKVKVETAVREEMRKAEMRSEASGSQEATIPKIQQKTAQAPHSEPKAANLIPSARQLDVDGDIVDLREMKIKSKNPKS